MRLTPSKIPIAGITEARTFFFSLYGGHGLHAGEWYELRCLDCTTEPPLPGPRVYCASLTELAESAAKHSQAWDVFFGVGYRRCPSTYSLPKCQHEKKGGIDHISRLPATWVDVDVVSPDEPKKRFATVADALEALYSLAVPPEIIVSSGAGLHAYWPLPEPSADLDRVVAINASIAAELGCDNCGDAPRILRVPGTFNRKHGMPLPVRIIEAPARGGV